MNPRLILSTVCVLVFVAGTRAGGNASKAGPPVKFKGAVTDAEQTEALLWYCGVSMDLWRGEDALERLVDWRMRLLREYGEKVKYSEDTIKEHATALFRRVTATPVPISLFATLNEVRSQYEAKSVSAEVLDEAVRVRCVDWMEENVEVSDEPSSLPSLLALWSIQGRRAFVNMLLIGLASGSGYAAGADFPEHDYDVDLPKEFDLREKAKEDGVECVAFTPGSQKGCGSCWAFSLAAAMSLRFCLQTHGSINTFVSPADVFRLNGAEGWLATAVFGDQGSDMLGIAAAAASMTDKRMKVRSAECSKYECVPVTERSHREDLQRERAAQRVSPMSTEEVRGVMLRHTARLWLAKTKYKGKKDFQVRAKEGTGPVCAAAGGEETLYGVKSGRLIFVAPDTVKKYEGKEGQETLRNWLKRELVTRGPVVFGADIGWMGMSNSEVTLDFMKSGTAPHAMTLIGWTEDQWILQNSWGEDYRPFKLSFDRVDMTQFVAVEPLKTVEMMLDAFGA